MSKSRLFKIFTFIFVSCIIVSSFFITDVSAHRDNQLSIIVQASPHSASKTIVQVASKKKIKQIIKSLSLSTRTIDPIHTDTYISIKEHKKVKKYGFYHGQYLYDLKTHKVLQVDRKAAIVLNELVKKARNKHYSDLIPWSEVKEIIPRKAKFKVTDVETGLSFQVQRRAGNKHADVQPLSKSDTKVMKEIYQGKWSWNRRAILIQVDDKQIAASMHGMPHGRGALRNGFPGHFCIHFYQSTTHRSKNVDLSHQLMVWKAAGKLDDFLHQANPFEIIDIFLMAINHHEPYLLQAILATEAKVPLELIKRKMATITHISRSSEYQQVDVNERLALELPVKIHLSTAREGEQKETITFILKRNSFLDRWQIASETLLQQNETVK